MEGRFGGTGNNLQPASWMRGTPLKRCTPMPFLKKKQLRHEAQVYIIRPEIRSI